MKKKWNTQEKIMTTKYNQLTTRVWLEYFSATRLDIVFEVWLHSRFMKNHICVICKELKELCDTSKVLLPMEFFMLIIVK